MGQHVTGGLAEEGPGKPGTVYGGIVAAVQEKGNLHDVGFINVTLDQPTPSGTAEVCVPARDQRHR